ncbi:tyrosine recombinase XerC [Chryseomicrobium excrementi]|uniref:Tyrosine recombinase XerC n=1 Tax=Chryseomicrobium excrementi TaxID=2041346 RepID=A0A2M9F343_9BACL|nr:tyrosine recombinase XerC [Chryseomicrobium excrementi]PJK17882.1 tyrosine recombinase XerC [Chryseomicrobium excrementi]
MESQELQGFLEYIQLDKNYSPHTVKEYESDLQQFIQFLKAEAISSFEEVEYVHARLFVTKLYDQKLARTTISRKISAIRTFFSYLAKELQVNSDAFQALFHPKQQKKLPQFFYEEELQALFEAAQGEQPLDLRNMALLELLYATGMRISELTNLEQDALDLSYGIVRVMGKGRKERYIPLGSFAQSALETYLQTARPRLMKAKDHEVVFVNHRGDPLTEMGVRHILQQIVKKSTLTKSIYPHMIRHTFATHLLNNGADMRTVQELLGHSSLSSTQIYTHVTKDHLLSTYKNAHPRA